MSVTETLDGAFPNHRPLLARLFGLAPSLTWVAYRRPDGPASPVFVLAEGFPYRVRRLSDYLAERFEVDELYEERARGLLRTRWIHTVGSPKHPH